MVIFNPQVPNSGVNDPNWTNVSRPISDIPADKSTALAITTATEALGSAVKITDTAIKDSAKKDVQTGVDNLRDGYLDALKTVRNAQIASTDQSLLPETDAPAAPAGLQSGLDRARNIGTALAQGGTKVNDTLYTGALNSLTKQLRAQYPGYRDYIDEQIQSVSGVNPANAFMKNLMEDINRGQENNKTETNAVKAQLRDLNVQGFHDTGGVTPAQILQGLNSGVINIDQAQRWMNSSKKLDYDTKAKTDARAVRLGDEADAAINATKDLSSTAAQTVAHNWTTMTIGKGTDTPATLFKFIQENAGNQNVKDERSQAIGQQLAQMRQATAQQLLAQANEGGKNSIVSKLGGDMSKVKGVIDGQLETFDLAIKSVFEKDWGAAYSHMNFNKAIGSDSTNIMYNAPDADVRKYNRMVGAINNISPQYGNDFFKNSLLSAVPQREKEFLKNTQMELLTQPDAPVGKLTSLQGQLDASKAKGVTSPKSYDELVKYVDTLNNPKVGLEQRLNVAKGFFDPTMNGQILADKNFDKDRYDATLKREIPGKYSVWRKFSSDNVASGIAELGKSDPTVIANYRATMTRNFGEQLFSRELKDLGEDNSNATHLSANYKIKFTNDAGSNPHFEAVRPNGSPMTMGEAAGYGAPVQSMNRLNEGMAGLYNVYSKTGSKDPVNDVMAAIYRYNYQDANSRSPRGYESIGDLPKAIMESITMANTARLKVQGDALRGQ